MDNIKIIENKTKEFFQENDLDMTIDAKAIDEYIENELDDVDNYETDGINEISIEDSLYFKNKKIKVWYNVEVTFEENERIYKFLDVALRK